MRLGGESVDWSSLVRQGLGAAQRRGSHSGILNKFSPHGATGRLPDHSFVSATMVTRRTELTGAAHAGPPVPVLLRQA